MLPQVEHHKKLSNSILELETPQTDSHLSAAAASWPLYDHDDQDRLLPQMDGMCHNSL